MDIKLKISRELSTLRENGVIKDELLSQLREAIQESTLRTPVLKKEALIVRLYECCCNHKEMFKTQAYLQGNIGDVERF